MSNMEDWDRRADADKKLLHFLPFIQMVYQHRLQTGATTAAQGGYINMYASLSAKSNVSNDNTAKTIAGTTNAHMENLLAQTTASLEAKANQINALLQQLVANNNQLNQQKQVILQHMAMLSMNPLLATMAQTYVPWATQIFALPPIQGYSQQYQQQFQQPYQQQYQQQGGGCGGGGHGGHAQCNRGRQRCGQMAPIQYIGGNQMIPYTPSGGQIQVAPKLQFTGIAKNWANQNMSFTCGFDMEDWHTSVTCPNKKQGHQDDFTRSNYMEYECANHQFCHEVMHKTMYPSM
jgi:hypothetical protein